MNRAEQQVAHEARKILNLSEPDEKILADIKGTMTEAGIRLRIAWRDFLDSIFNQLEK